MEVTKKRAHLWITGYVQGVFFRAFAQDTARDLDVTGWVRNTEDGKVEAVVEGPIDRISKFIKEMRKGPSSAKVEHVDVKWEEYRGEFTNFSMRY